MLGEEDFDVQSCDGVSRCTAQASRVFLRGIEPTYRLVLSNGQSMSCSARHQILTAHGWRSLHDYVRLCDGWRCQETIEDSTASYAICTHQYDAPLLVNLALASSTLILVFTNSLVTLIKSLNVTLGELAINEINSLYKNKGFLELKLYNRYKLSMSIYHLSY